MDKYDELCILGHGVPPSIRQLAKTAQVSRSWTQKVIGELQSQGGLVAFDLAKAERLKEPGSQSLDSFDIAVLLYCLLCSNPSCSLMSHQQELFPHAGTIVSRSTICHLWRHGFDTAATLWQSNLVPIDKLKPSNIEWAVEYIQIVLLIDPHWLKFCDEKSLKGEEIFVKKVRRELNPGSHVQLRLTQHVLNYWLLWGGPIKLPNVCQHPCAICD